MATETQNIGLESQQSEPWFVTEFWWFASDWIVATTAILFIFFTLGLGLGVLALVEAGGFLLLIIWENTQRARVNLEKAEAKVEAILMTALSPWWKLLPKTAARRALQNPSFTAFAKKTQDKKSDEEAVKEDVNDLFTLTDEQKEKAQKIAAIFSDISVWTACGISVQGTPGQPPQIPFIIDNKTIWKKGLNGRLNPAGIERDYFGNLIFNLQMPLGLDDKTAQNAAKKILGAVRTVQSNVEDVIVVADGGRLMINIIEFVPEVPKMVTFEEVQNMAKARGMQVVVGKTAKGECVAFDISETGQNAIIVAGAQGSGKSVAIMSMICSIVLQNSPDTVRLVLIDPKRVEYSFFKNAPEEERKRGIAGSLPHLYAPVETGPLGAVQLLDSMVKEMLARFDLLEQKGYRHIKDYNSANPDKALPLIVVFIDEFADLVMAATSEDAQIIAENKSKQSQEKEVANTLESLFMNVQRIMQLGRAAGFSTILCTQYPTVDYLPGAIKANAPNRMSFQLSTSGNSMVVLDEPGAEALTGRGHGLFKSAAFQKDGGRIEFRGAFLSDDDVRRIVSDAISKYGPADFSCRPRCAVDILSGRDRVSFVKEEVAVDKIETEVQSDEAVTFVIDKVELTAQALITAVNASKGRYSRDMLMKAVSELGKDRAIPMTYMLKQGEMKQMLSKSLGWKLDGDTPVIANDNWKNAIYDIVREQAEKTKK